MENMNDEEERDATNKLVAELNEKQKKIKEEMMVASSHSSSSSSSSSSSTSSHSSSSSSSSSSSEALKASFRDAWKMRVLWMSIYTDIAKISQKINNTVVDDEEQEKLELEIANKKKERVNAGMAYSRSLARWYGMIGWAMEKHGVQTIIRRATLKDALDAFYIKKKYYEKAEAWAKVKAEAEAEAAKAAAEAKAKAEADDDELEEWQAKKAIIEDNPSLFSSIMTDEEQREYMTLEGFRSIKKRNKEKEQERRMGGEGEIEGEI